MQKWIRHSVSFKSLFRYNWCTISFTHVKYTNHKIVNHESWAQPRQWTEPSLPEVSSVTSAILFLFPSFLSSSPKKLVICFLYFLEFYIKGIMAWHFYIRFTSFSLIILRCFSTMSFSSVQFSSVAQSCPTLCDLMNRSMPGLPDHHQLPEFTQTHVHLVADAIQPSHSLLSPSPPAPNPFQHQSLFQWVNSSHEVAKVLACINNSFLFTVE